MTDNPRLDDHAPRGRAQTPGERSAAASAEAGTAACPARAEAASALSRLPRGPLDLSDEATRVAVPNPSRPDAKIIVATGHRGPAPVKIPADGAANIVLVRVIVSSASKAHAGADKKLHSTQPHAPRPTAVLLSRRPIWVRDSARFRHRHASSVASNRPLFDASMCRSAKWSRSDTPRSPPCSSTACSSRITAVCEPSRHMSLSDVRGTITGNRA